MIIIRDMDIPRCCIDEDGTRVCRFAKSILCDALPLSMAMMVKKGPPRPDWCPLEEWDTDEKLSKRDIDSWGGYF